MITKNKVKIPWIKGEAPNVLEKWHADLHAKAESEMYRVQRTYNRGSSSRLPLSTQQQPLFKLFVS